MIFLTAMDFTLPLADPVLKFLIILLIILGAPLLLNNRCWGSSSPEP